ncbi:hypothetical protein LguiA_030039 [Lonicera macranthoides]
MRWTASEYVKVINRILIVHNGTIQKFILHIPIAQRPDMDLWILILSKNRIKELTLRNAYSQPYKLPCVVSGVEVEQQKDFNLMVLLSKITEIRILWLDGFSLKFLAAGTEKEYLPMKVYNLAKVWLISIQFNDLEQVLCALCLLRSSPNLQHLKIEISTITNDGLQQVLNSMEASGNFNIEVLNELQTVELKSCILKAALHFAKLLLSHSPSLKRMTIDNRAQSTNANEQLRIATELMRLPRASTKAELIYLL